MDPSPPPNNACMTYLVGPSPCTVLCPPFRRAVDRTEFRSLVPTCRFPRLFPSIGQSESLRQQQGRRTVFAVPLSSRHCSPSPTLMAVCVDPSGDGLHPISRARPFDFALCFERLVLLPALAAAFALVALANVAYLLRTHPVLERGKTSRLLLRAELVRYDIQLPHSRP